MQMSVSQSVNLSVSLSVCNAYLFVRFTSIFYNSKSYQMKQYLKDLKPLNLSQHTCTSVLVLLQMTGGNDISLIYPWININMINNDIASWIKREEDEKEKQFSEDVLSLDNCFSSLDKANVDSCRTRRKLIQGILEH